MHGARVGEGGGGGAAEDERRDAPKRRKRPGSGPITFCHVNFGNIMGLVRKLQSINNQLIQRPVLASNGSQTRSTIANGPHLEAGIGWRVVGQVSADNNWNLALAATADEMRRRSILSSSNLSSFCAILSGSVSPARSTMTGAFMLAMNMSERDLSTRCTVPRQPQCFTERSINNFNGYTHCVTLT